MSPPTKISVEDGEAHRELANATDSILKAKRIVFVSGAGISCSAGIPDFRSMNGLYNSNTNYCKIKGKDLFDVSLFRSAETEAMFYQFMESLRCDVMRAQPTAMHKFMRTLKEHGKLLRAYTQNIDGLEIKAGLEPEADFIQLHGDLETLKCNICASTSTYTQTATDHFRAGEAPRCTVCADKCAIREAAGRRSLAIGKLRPDVVLYGEDHPSGDNIASACSRDLKRKPDCLIIAGTTLRIPGFKRLIKDFAKAVHDRKGKVIFLNMTDLSTSEWDGVIDIHIQGECDKFIDFMRSYRPEAFKRQSTLDDLPRTKEIMSIAALCGNVVGSCHKSKMCSKPIAVGKKRKLIDANACKLNASKRKSKADSCVAVSQPLELQQSAATQELSCSKSGIREQTIQVIIQHQESTSASVHHQSAFGKENIKPDPFIDIQYKYTPLHLEEIDYLTRKNLRSGRRWQNVNTSIVPILA